MAVQCDMFRPSFIEKMCELALSDSRDYCRAMEAQKRAGRYSWVHDGRRMEAERGILFKAELVERRLTYANVSKGDGA